MACQFKTRSIPLPSSEDERAERMAVLLRELEFLSPKKHRYFCKQYKLESSINEIPLLLRDIEDYQVLITNQSKKIITYLHEYKTEPSLAQLISSFLQYSEDFSNKNMQTMHRLSKKHDGDEKMEGTAENNRCSECSRMISDYRVERMKEELNLNKFQDHCGFFNVDRLNFSDHLDLAGLRKQSNNIIQSELLTEDNQFEYKGGCISYEQYEEVLNLLGSDLHQKNSSIEKIIDYLNKTDKRLVNEDRLQEKQTEEEIRSMQSIVQNNGIKERLKDIVKLFFQRYVKMKIHKRKDCEVQANIKENDVIKQLQKEKKGLKSRIYQLSTEKERAAIHYQARIKMLELEIESNRTSFKQEMEKTLGEISKLQQKFAEEYHLHDLHRKELQKLGNQHTALLALLSRRNINLNARSKEPRPSSSNRSRSSIKKTKSKERIRFPKRELNNPSEHNDRDSDSDIHSKGEIVEGTYHKLSSLQIQKAVENFASLSEISKKKAYQKIQEKQEEQEQGIQSTQFRMSAKRKTSRFKAMMTHFSSNTSLHTQTAKTKPQRITFANPKRNSNGDQDTIEPQIRILKENSGSRLDTDSKYQMLLKLYESQRSSQHVSIEFPSFLQLYNDFIITVSEKVVSRSLSMNNELKKRELKQRVSILSSKLDNERPTVKFIDDRHTSTASRKKSKNQREKEQAKLEPLEKKSQYYLKKNTSRNAYEFKSYSKTAQHTLRADIESTVSVKEVPQPIPIFSPEEIQQLFLGKENISNFQAESRKNDTELATKGEQQALMKLYAEMANLHVNNCKDYEQVKTVLTHPNHSLTNQSISFQIQTINHLKTSIKHLIRLHRPCRKDGTCLHLTTLLTKLQTLSAPK